MPIKEWKDSRGQKRIYVSKQLPDGSRIRRVQPNKTVAKKTLARLEEAVAMGTWRELKEELTRRPKDEEKVQPTIAGLSEVYLEHCELRNRRPDFKEQALSVISRIVGDVKLSDFSVVHADRFVEVRSRLDEVKPATTNRGLAVLKHMLNFARKRGQIEVNPLLGYEMLPEQGRSLKIMEVSEYRTLVEAVAEVDLVVGGMSAVVGETGIRRSEALRMERNHINLNARKLTVAQSKSGRARYIPLSDFALEWLSRLPRVINSQFVFVQLSTGRPWKDPRGPFQRGRDDCGLAWVKGFHDLRHFRATQWLMNGIDVRTVQELLGHADINTTMRYVHYIQSHAEKAVQKAQERDLRSMTGR
jgi:integrase